MPLISIYIVLALTAGGTGNNVGAVVGAFLVVFFLESTRFLTGGLPGLKPVQVAAVREFLIGASLIVALRFRPYGLAPERIPATRRRRRRDEPRTDALPHLQAVAAALTQPGQSAPLWTALERALAAVIGHRLFTVLRYHPDWRESER